MPFASSGSTMAGWTSAAAEKGVLDLACAVRETILPPQHMPREPHFWMLGEREVIWEMREGIFEAVEGGLAGPEKKAPSFFCFSSVSGGKSEGE